MRTRISATIIALALVGGACTTGSLGTAPFGVLSAFALRQFDACDAFLDYVKTNALEHVGPYGLDGYGYPFYGPFMLDDVGGGPESATTTLAAAARGEAGVDYSTTNVQELGIDEPDFLKTDGNRLVVVSEGVLYVVDITDRENPRITGRIATGNWGVTDLLLNGDTVLLLGNSSRETPVPLLGDTRLAPDLYYPSYYSPVVELVELDIADPAAIRLVRTMHIDGAYVSARMIGTSVRVVLSTPPVGLAWVYPQGSGLQAEDAATEANREVIRSSTEANWIPYYRIEEGGVTAASGALFGCQDAYHPAEYAGLSMLTVLTLDMAESLAPIASAGVLAGGEQVYASENALYVTTQKWIDWVAYEDELNRVYSGEIADPASVLPTVTTEIHAFDITDPRDVRYLASGQVPGYALNQFSLDEYQGNLRVATTETPEWWGGPQPVSQSYVTVLRDDGAGVLQKVGQIGGLGAGERIYAVRFIDDVGYVVTFRQTDPLYVLDLRNPAGPVVSGELKIPGYSAYLHPMGDGLLVGVGQDADEEGRVRGLQVSVFDVSDPADPQRIQQYVIENGGSEAEWDHHAFLYWAAEDLLVLPVQRWGRWIEPLGNEGGGYADAFMGAIALRVTANGIEPLAEVSHPQTAVEDFVRENYGPVSAEELTRIVEELKLAGFYDWQVQIRRAMVAGDELFTVSSRGVLATGLTDFAADGFAGFQS